MSDVPGRSMVMGAITVNCGQPPGQPPSLEATGTSTDVYVCETYPDGAKPDHLHRVVYSPCLPMNAAGHGTYSELVQEQPGSGDFLLGAGTI